MSVSLRKSVVLFSSCLVALLGLASTARAASPQHFAFEVKFGPYVPAIDQSAGLNGATPFSDLMGDPNDPYGSPPPRGLLSQGEFDYQFLNRFGILGVGISAGYYRRSQLAFQSLDKTGTRFCQVSDAGDGTRQYTDPGGPKPTMQRVFESCVSPGEENVFNVVPLALLVVYRFDVLDKRFRIPLIPYVKVGLGYYIWWEGKTSSFVSTVGSASADKSQGATAGLVLNPGIAIDLSALDPHAARAIDQEIGLNRVTAFVEMNGSFMGGWGATSPKLNLSDLTFSAGLGFEF